MAATSSRRVFIVSTRIRSHPAAASAWAISRCSRSSSGSDGDEIGPVAIFERSDRPGHGDGAGPVPGRITSQPDGQSDELARALFSFTL